MNKLVENTEGNKAICFDWVTKCCQSLCQASATHWCGNHQKTYCDEHSLALHSQCSLMAVPSGGFINEGLRQVDKQFELFTSKGTLFNMNLVYSEYDTEVGFLKDEFNDLRNCIVGVSNTKDMRQALLLHGKVLNFKIKIDRSAPKTQLANFIFEHNLLSSLIDSTQSSGSENELEKLAIERQQVLLEESERLKNINEKYAEECESLRQQLANSQNSGHKECAHSKNGIYFILKYQ